MGFTFGCWYADRFVLSSSIRFACALEDAGYFKNLKQEEGQGGGGSTSAMFGEIDKITRPNEERIVTEAKKECRIVV